jgi:hypothetical protein
VTVPAIGGVVVVMSNGGRMLRLMSVRAGVRVGMGWPFAVAVKVPAERLVRKRMLVHWGQASSRQEVHPLTESGFELE